MTSRSNNFRTQEEQRLFNSRRLALQIDVIRQAQGERLHPIRPNRGVSNEFNADFVTDFGDTGGDYDNITENADNSSASSEDNQQYEEEEEEEELLEEPVGDAESMTNISSDRSDDSSDDEVETNDRLLPPPLLLLPEYANAEACIKKYSLTKEAIEFNQYHKLLKLQKPFDFKCPYLTDDDGGDAKFSEKINDSLTFGQLLLLLISIKINHICSDETLSTFLSIVCYSVIMVMLQ